MASPAGIRGLSWWRASFGICIFFSCFSSPPVQGAPQGKPAEQPESLPAPPAFEPCELRGSGGQGRVAAECGYFHVPEDPDEPDGRTIELFVTRIPALTPEPAADAVTLINGGPGGSSVSMYVDLQAAFSALRRERDIVVMDQRGTGRSAPLDCPSLEEATYELELEVVRAATRACLESLDHDPRRYTTSLAVADLEALRRAMGYRRWNLYGVSYGTRVAQHYLQRYPDAVRTMIIDGVVPQALALGPDIALNAQRALDTTMSRCAAEDYCARAFPDLKGQLHALAERLRRDPVALEVPHPVTGRTESLELHYGQLAMSLRLMSYAPETTALIPLVVREAAEQENYLPLAAQALRIETTMMESISFGMHNSVVCTEDVPFYRGLEALQPKLEATYLGADQVRALQAICEIWPRGNLHPDLRQAVESNRPVLLLSGELDPITPPAYGEQAAAGYPNSRHLVARGQGHGVAPRGCVPALINDFVTAGSLEAVDASCMERFQADPFFVNLLGPPP